MAWPKGVKRQSKGGKMVRKAEETNSKSVDMISVGRIVAILLDNDFDIKKWELNPETMEMTLIVKEKQGKIK